MHDIPQSWKDVLQAMVLAPVAWQTPADLAGVLGSDLEATTDLLADLEASGWIETWEHDDVLVVTLSVLGSERLGVRLVEIGPGRQPRWGFVGDPEPPAPRARGVARDVKTAELLSVVDPGPGPLLSAEIAERGAVAAQSALGSVPLPRPTLLIGQGLTPWPGPLNHDAEPIRCPACHGSPLQPHMYCLSCDRWGLDHLLSPAVSQRRAPSGTFSTTLRRPRTRRDEAKPPNDRDRRKARHALRMAAREQAERDRRAKAARTPWRT